MKLAVTQMSSGTNIASAAPGCANWPTAALRTDDASGLSRRDVGVGEVEPGLVELGLSLGEARLGGGALGVQRVDLPLGELQRRLGGVDRGALLVELGRRLLGVEHRARAGLRELTGSDPPADRRTPAPPAPGSTCAWAAAICACCAAIWASMRPTPA